MHHLYPFIVNPQMYNGSLPHALGDRQTHQNKTGKQGDRRTHQNKTGKHVSLLIFFFVIQVNPLRPDAPCFIILLCLILPRGFTNQGESSGA